MDNNKGTKTSSSKCNMNNSNETLDLGLDCFSYADFVLLSSTLSFVIGEELNDADLDLFIIFLGMVSADLALISTKRAILRRRQASQNQNNVANAVIDTTISEEEGSLVAALPRKSKIKKKKIYKKKKIKKQLD